MSRLIFGGVKQAHGGGISYLNMGLYILIIFVFRKCFSGRRIELLLKLPPVEPLQEEPDSHKCKKASNLCQTHDDGGGVPGGHKDRRRDLEHNLDIVTWETCHLLVVP